MNPDRPSVRSNLAVGVIAAVLWSVVFASGKALWFFVFGVMP